VFVDQHNNALKIWKSASEGKKLYRKLPTLQLLFLIFLIVINILLLLYQYGTIVISPI